MYTVWKPDEFTSKIVQELVLKDVYILENKMKIQFPKSVNSHFLPIRLVSL